MTYDFRQAQLQLAKAQEWDTPIVHLQGTKVLLLPTLRARTKYALQHMPITKPFTTAVRLLAGRHSKYAIF